MVFFFNDTATTEIYTLSLHDALPICQRRGLVRGAPRRRRRQGAGGRGRGRGSQGRAAAAGGRSAPARRARRERRSEEHTSELQSRQYLVCRLLLEKKNLLLSVTPTHL